jgi:hypothetical protein
MTPLRQFARGHSSKWDQRFESGSLQRSLSGLFLASPNPGTRIACRFVTGYPNKAEAKEVTAAQIAAHSPNDKNNTAITDPSLPSRRLWAGFPSGRTVGRSSAGYAPANRTLLPSISPNPRSAAHFLYWVRDALTLILPASKKRPGWRSHGRYDRMTLASRKKPCIRA